MKDKQLDTPITAPPILDTIGFISSIITGQDRAKIYMSQFI